MPAIPNLTNHILTQFRERLQRRDKPSPQWDIDRYGNSSYIQEIKMRERLLGHYRQTGNLLKLSEQAPEDIEQRN
jgi:hypothetical protein